MSGVMSAIAILTVYYYFVSQGAQASPIPVINVRLKASSCNDIHNCRTVWDIVWSCLSTIVLCTWVAVHPNIPSPSEGWFGQAFRRMKIMAITILAPEVTILWAVRQRLIATRLTASRKSRGAASLPSPLIFLYIFTC